METTLPAVVPRKGDVDRNLEISDAAPDVPVVVPRKGDVDRNSFALLCM